MDERLMQNLILIPELTLIVGPGASNATVQAVTELVEKLAGCKLTLASVGPYRIVMKQTDHTHLTLDVARIF